MKKTLGNSKSIVIAGTQVVLCATAVARQDLDPGGTNTGSPSSISAHHVPPAKPTEFGGIAGGFDCTFDNYFPLDDNITPASQRDVVEWFWAEAAADFVITGESDTTCTIDFLIAGVYFFNPPLGGTPLKCWDGISVTVYEDGASFCGKGFLKGPAGNPVDCCGGDEHVEFCKGSIVCELEVPMSKVGINGPMPASCLGHWWEVVMFGLAEFGCSLQKDHQYWIAIAPVMQFTDCGQTALILSQGAFGNIDQQVFLLLGLPWTEITGNIDFCPPDTPPAGTWRDLAIGIGLLDDACVADLNGDGVVGAADVAIILGDWGPCDDCEVDINDDGVVGPADLAIVLGNWGVCS